MYRCTCKYMHVHVCTCACTYTCIKLIVTTEHVQVVRPVTLLTLCHTTITHFALLSNKATASTLSRLTDNVRGILFRMSVVTSPIATTSSNDSGFSSDSPLAVFLSFSLALRTPTLYSMESTHFVIYTMRNCANEKSQNQTVYDIHMYMYSTCKMCPEEV